jgi:hypothetical protein
MRKLHILVEGQTEEVVVNDVIRPYLSSDSLHVTTSILKTKRPAGGPAYKGGALNWQRQILPEIRLLLNDTSTTLLTTLIDYYAFPTDAPGMDSRPHGSPYDRVGHVEHALAIAVDSGRFLLPAWRCDGRSGRSGAPGRNGGAEVQPGTRQRRR